MASPVRVTARVPSMGIAAGMGATAPWRALRAAGIPASVPKCRRGPGQGVQGALEAGQGVERAPTPAGLGWDARLKRPRYQLPLSSRPGSVGGMNNRRMATKPPSPTAASRRRWINWTCLRCDHPFRSRTRRGLYLTCPSCGSVQPGPEGVRAALSKLGDLELRSRRRGRPEGRDQPRRSLSL